MRCESHREKKKEERNRERKQKKEQKRKEKNAEIRRRTGAMAIAYYVKEAEYYLEEREYFVEEKYDDEQCAFYHQNHFEEMLNDIRKRLYQRSQPARTSRHSRWEKEIEATKESKGRTNKRRRSRSSFTRRSNSKSKRRRTTRRGRR